MKNKILFYFVLALVMAAVIAAMPISTSAVIDEGNVDLGSDISSNVTSSAIVSSDVSSTIVSSDVTSSKDDAYILGDVDGSGKIDSSDLLSLQQHLIGISPLSGKGLAAADVNSSNLVDSSDMLAMQQHLLGIASISAVK